MKEVSLKNDAVFQERLIALNALLPAALLAWNWQRGQLGANPIEFTTRMTGVMSLIFLAITLLVTPLRKVFGMGWLARLRRSLGLYAFYYGAAHLTTYVVWDRNLSIFSVPADVLLRPFIAVGMIAFLLMVPLAVTSTNAMIKKLGGKKWTLLHKLTYPVIIGGVVHYWMIVKSDIRWPMFFAVLTAILLGYRIFDAVKNKKPKPTTSA
jgi:sulfoxide reductase heme-binding subunit YedZ